MRHQCERNGQTKKKQWIHERSATAAAARKRVAAAVKLKPQIHIYLREK